MCAAKITPTSKSTPPALDLKKLNPAESLQLLNLANQKSPEFANDVSKVTDRTESRIRIEATQKFYGDIAKKLWGEIHSADDFDDREGHQVDPPGPEADTLATALLEIEESLNNQTSDEDLEIGFETSLKCWGSIVEVLEGVNKKQVYFDDLDRIVDAAKDVVREMALLWVMKGGRYSKDRHQRILKLLEENLRIQYDANDDIKEALEEELELLELEEGAEDEEQDNAEDSKEADEEEEGEKDEGPQLKRKRVE